MEKIKSICILRDLVKSVSELQSDFNRRFGISLKEAMVLCCIGESVMTSGEISEQIGIPASATSKAIRGVETKGLVSRKCGDNDRRCMEFALSHDGREILRRLKTEGIELPPFLRPLFDAG